MSKSQYESATDEKLDLIIKQAEDKLQAQLALGIAADQRSMTLGGILAALAAALVALAGDRGVTWSTGIMIAALLVATGLAMFAAQPIAWDTPGNTPVSWIDDIADGTDNLHSARAAMADFYAQMISDNANLLRVNGGIITWAMGIALAAPFLGGLALVIA